VEDSVPLRWDEMSAEESMEWSTLRTAAAISLDLFHLTGSQPLTLRVSEQIRPFLISGLYLPELMAPPPQIDPEENAYIEQGLWR